jgi:hypothetical protein
MGAVSKCRENVVQVLVLGAGVANAVGYQKREAESLGQLYLQSIASFLTAPMMALELDMQALGKERRQAVEERDGTGAIAFLEQLGERSLSTSGQTVESLGVSGKKIQVG